MRRAKFHEPAATSVHRRRGWRAIVLPLRGSSQAHHALSFPHRTQPPRAMESQCRGPLALVGRETGTQGVSVCERWHAMHELAVYTRVCVCVCARARFSLCKQACMHGMQSQAVRLACARRQLHTTDVDVDNAIGRFVRKGTNMRLQTGKPVIDARRSGTPRIQTRRRSGC